MIQHILADTGSSGTVEINGRYYGGIVGNKEVTVYGREQSNSIIGEMPKAMPKGISARTVAAWL